MEHLTSTQQKMVEENHNLIYGMAHKYKINLDEYYDVLAIGLCKAAMTFDETKGQFSTFAYVTMLNEYNAVLRHNKTYMVIPEQNLVSMNTQMISDDGNGVVEYGDLFPADVDIEKTLQKQIMYLSCVIKLIIHRNKKSSSYWLMDLHRLKLQKNGCQSPAYWSVNEQNSGKIEEIRSMSVGCLCSHCNFSDCNRRNDNKIRCTRYSQWVNPNDIGCDVYVGAMSFADMSPEKMKEIAELYHDLIKNK